MNTILKIALLLFVSIRFASANTNDGRLKLTTYNAGLAHTFVKYAGERVEKVVDGLSKLDSDVLCLQEVWTKKDRKKIIKSLKKKYPHSFLTKIKQTKSKRRPTCRIKELFGEGKFVQCMKDKCGDASGDEFTTCIINDCKVPLVNLKNSNRECVQGLMAQVGKSTLASLFTVLNPFKAAGQFTYKGSNGLIILSRIPFDTKDVIDFSDISFLSRRSALRVNVTKNGKPHQIACTHLTANLDGTAPYAGKFENWSEENLAQVDRLIKNTSKSDQATYLLGDFNCSLQNIGADVESEFEGSCKKFLAAGYSDPIAEQNAECTFCRTNTLVNEGNDPHGYKNKLLDHIFTIGAEATSSKVVMKQKVKITVKKKEIETHLSDHFGVSVFY
jgi:endonuclease/exonuclease/phosphatase family metal-dependent hydrolase